MSIVACVKVNDGIVLGAESMSQLWGQTAPGAANQFVKAFSNARKVFQLADLPFGALTYGVGNIGSRSVENLLREFRANLAQDFYRDQLSGQALADRLLAFVRSKYDPLFANAPQRPTMGFYIAGYAVGDHLATEWEFVLPQDNTARQSRPDDQFGAAWRGVTMPFSRLHFGADPRIADALRAAGMPNDQVDAFEREARNFVSPVVFDSMPLQDAIGFCKHILVTTIST
jgi:hypothetical protein